jgi:GT2 family glycosyltransferase
VVVSFNSAAELPACLDSLAAQRGVDVDVHVVDNASSDGSAELVRARYPGVRLTANSENLGFARACNQVLLSVDAPAYALVNPDTVLSPGAIAACLDRLEQDPGAGIVAARIVHPDGRLQASCHGFLGLGNLFGETFFLDRLLPGVRPLSSLNMTWFAHDRVAEVDWVMGSFLVVRGATCRQVGGFDPDFFMYAEEMEWCYRVRRAGWKVVFLPAPSVVHVGGASSRPIAGPMFVENLKGKLRFFRKHRGGAATLAARALLACSVLLRHTGREIQALALRLAGRAPAEPLRLRLAMFRAARSWVLRGLPLGPPETPAPPQTGGGPAAALRLFALAIGVRLVLWLTLGAPRPLAGDQAEYLALRDGLLATGRFLDPSTGQAMAFRDIGYPAFLALLGRLGLGALPFLWLAQILLSSLAGVLLFAALRRASGSHAARSLAWLFLLQLSLATYCFMAYTETLVCFLCCALVYALVRWRERPDAARQALAGAAGAACFLTRAACVLGGACVILTAAAGRGRAGRAWALGVVVLAVPLLLWTARNAAVVGVPSLNTAGVFNVYQGNNPDAPMVHSYRIDTPAGELMRGKSDAERSRLAWRLTTQYALHHPGQMVARGLLRIPDALEADRMLIGLARRGQFPDRPAPFPFVVGVLLLLATGVPTLLGLAAALSPGDHWLGVAGRWMLVGTLLTQVLTVAHPRYTLPAWIVLLPAAALMVERLARGERSARVAVGAAALVLAAVWIRQAILG